jgi:hypothetical protein
MRALWLAWMTMGPSMMATAPTAPAWAQEAAPVLVLRISDPERQAPFSLHGVHAEVQRLFAPLGVRVLLDGEPDTEGQTSVQVILLSRDRSHGGVHADTMGAVQRSEGSNSAVWILLSNVHYALGGSREHQALLPVELVARAVGRVLAHELVHLIMPEMPHASTGLMQPRLGRAFLLKDELRLDPALSSVLRTRLASRMAHVQTEGPRQ